jgi:hypothetical protein
MNDEYSKQWLLIESCIKKLKNGRHWMTSLDAHTADVDEAIKKLEQALKKIEES